MSTNKKYNVVLLVTDGHGKFTGNMDWGTKEFHNLKERLDRLDLVQKGYVSFTNAISPAVSTIMSIESIMSGLFAAKTHKLHWRQWPVWDRFSQPVLSEFLEQQGYDVDGFSYLLNSENWLPCMKCYKPELYKNFPSFKRDTHSHEAVLVAIKHYFENAFNGDGSHFLAIHSIFVFDFWEALMDELSQNGITEDNTIFVLTSDHYFPENFGRQWLLGERDNSLIFHHIDLSEHNIRVPLYLKYPNSKGLEIDGIVSGYDIAPTLIDLLGMSSQWPGKFDGISLVPLLKGQSILKRMVRTDNLYPYQIGEKQGRVVAIRNGKYKYIFRPDPITSYIAYRLSRSWEDVLGSEEFFDIENDPQENKNLINESSENILEEIDKCRKYLRKTNEDIIGFHVETLRDNFRVNNLKNNLFVGRQKGRILCIQSTSNIVFETIVRVLMAELQEWDIDIMVKNSNAQFLPDVKEKIIYAFDGVYQKDKFVSLIDSKAHGYYDCIINTSNVPMGDYAGVYDERYYPVGDLKSSTEIISFLNPCIKAILCLDMTYKKIYPFNIERFLEVISLKKAIKIIRFLLRKLRPLLRKLNAPLNSKNVKINRGFAERIITSKD